jgi:acyl carrier protein
MGGATEASIWSIVYPIGEVGADWVSIPYGRPMRNQTFHVLDRDLEPRPVGVQGHLYIGGIGLAQGYWRDEEKTAASFVTQPRTGERLYRTGDLGRMLPDGNIEFLGRDDFQVKIQGHRIELGEIESALIQHPAVAAAVATAHGDLRGAKQLAAYVVLAAPGEGESDLLRREASRAWADLAAGAAPADLLARRPFEPAPVALDDLAAVLAALLRVEIPGSPFPKLRYGSAGNLYPVQAYVAAAPGAVTGLAGGAYYYDPQGHALVDLAGTAAVDPAFFAGAGFAIFLVAQLAAIEPLYGDLSRRFVALEAGLMAELLAATAAERGLALAPATRSPGSLRSLLALDESHLPVQALLGGFAAAGEATEAGPEPGLAPEDGGAPSPTAVLTDPFARFRFKLAHHNLRPDQGWPRIALAKPALGPERIEDLYVARRSYRSFQTGPVPLAALGTLLAAQPPHGDLALYLYAKPGRVEGLPGGAYAYDPAARRLDLLTPGAALTAALYEPVNRDVFEAAGFALLFVTRAADRRRAALEAGRRAQSLETAAPALRIGLAQMGGLRFDGVRERFRLGADDELVHTMLGGRIAAGQVHLAAFQAEAAAYYALEDGVGAPPPAPAAPPEPDVLAEIRDFLSRKLPAYMVPPHLLRIESLPLSANGKVDRKALPEPEALRSLDKPAGGAFVAPQSDLERVVATAVAQVLELPRVGLHDNFFDLGASSVHVVRVHNAIHAALGVEISLIELFNHPSVHRLAQYLGEKSGPPVLPPPAQAEERADRLREGKDWRQQRLQKRQTERRNS